MRPAKIAPRQSYTRSLFLSEWVTFDQVGAYGVQISLSGADGVASFDVDVAPRDENRLRSLCGLLATRESEPRWDGDQDPARVLSFVSDDVAIPRL